MEKQHNIEGGFQLEVTKVKFWGIISCFQPTARSLPHSPVFITYSSPQGSATQQAHTSGRICPWTETSETVSQNMYLFLSSCLCVSFSTCHLQKHNFDQHKELKSCTVLANMRQISCDFSVISTVCTASEFTEPFTHVTLLYDDLTQQTHVC